MEWEDQLELRVRQCSDAECRHRLEHFLIDIAPAPVLAGLEASDDRVVRSVEVGRRMAIRRIVAAPDVSAGETEPEMNPPAAHLQAFLTALGSSRLFSLNLVEMLAPIVCHRSARRV
jgi:hypothetical protein